MTPPRRPVSRISKRRFGNYACPPPHWLPNYIAASRTMHNQDGGREVRTPNHRVWNPMRYPLRHTPAGARPRTWRSKVSRAESYVLAASPREKTIRCFLRSIVPRFDRSVFLKVSWSRPSARRRKPCTSKKGQGDSNSQPSGLQSDALPIAPYPRLSKTTGLAFQGFARGASQRGEKPVREN